MSNPGKTLEMMRRKTWAAVVVLVVAAQALAGCSGGQAREGREVVDTIPRGRIDTLRGMFLALPDTTAFADGEVMPEGNGGACWLLGRIVRMQPYARSAEEIYAMAEAVDALMEEYGRRAHPGGDAPTLAGALAEIGGLVASPSPGADARLQAYLGTVVSSLATVARYRELVSEVDDGVLQGLLYDDFRCWCGIIEGLSGVLYEYTFAGSDYSARSLEINNVTQGWFGARMGELEAERDIILGNATHVADCGKVTPGMFTKVIDTLIRCWLGDRADGDAAVALISAIRSGTVRDAEYDHPVRDVGLLLDGSLNNWLETRRRIADRLGGDAGASYARMTDCVYAGFYEEMVSLCHVEE